MKSIKYLVYALLSLPLISFAAEQYGPPKFKVSDIRQGNYYPDVPAEAAAWDNLVCGVNIQTDPTRNEITVIFVANPKSLLNCWNSGETTTLTCPTGYVKDCASNSRIRIGTGSNAPFRFRHDFAMVDFVISAKAGNAIHLDEQWYFPAFGRPDEIGTVWGGSDKKRFIFHDSNAPTVPKYFLAGALITNSSANTTQERNCKRAKENYRHGGLDNCQEYSANCQVYKEQLYKPANSKACGYAVIYQAL